MPQDHLASVVSQARVIRDGLDLRAPETKIRTATLELLLNTLIGLGTLPTNAKLAEALQRKVEGQTVSIARAQEAFNKVIEAETSAAEARFGR